jgi:hypothetical protein
MQIKEIVQVFLSLIISAPSIIWWKVQHFFIKFFLLQYMKIIKVYKSCIWLCELCFAILTFFFWTFYV